MTQQEQQSTEIGVAYGPMEWCVSILQIWLREKLSQQCLVVVVVVVVLNVSVCIVVTDLVQSLQQQVGKRD